MEFTIHNTQAVSSLKADGIIYGLVMEIAMVLFMVPFIGFAAGLMFSYSKKLQYGCMGISFLVFLIIWGWLSVNKKAKTLDYLVRFFIYNGSVKYIYAQYYSLLDNNKL